MYPAALKILSMAADVAGNWNAMMHCVENLQSCKSFAILWILPEDFHLFVTDNGQVSVYFTGGINL